MGEPSLLIVAGPNDAGKTTYAFRNLESVTGHVTLVNLDEIARGYPPLRPSLGQQYAARAALERTRSLIREGASFSIKTTLSGKTHLRTIAAAKAAGYRVSLFYFAAPDVETCLARIARRVADSMCLPRTCGGGFSARWRICRIMRGRVIHGGCLMRRGRRRR